MTQPDNKPMEFPIENSKGLCYKVFLYPPTPSRGPGFSFPRSNILPMENIPYFISALANIYTCHLEAINHVRQSRKADGEAPPK